MASPAVAPDIEKRLSHESVVVAKRDYMKHTNEVTIASGHILAGEELEDFCSERGLCPLCARTRTRRKIFKLFKRSRWERLTVTNKKGEYTVYKGFCVKPDCFSLEQAKRMVGDGLKKSSSRPRYPKRWSSVEDNYHLGDDDTVVTATATDGTRRKNEKSFPTEGLKDNMMEKPTDVNKPLSIISHTVQVMRADPSIVVLDLSMIQIRSIDISTLCSCLVANTTLSSLIMENCIMDDEQAIILGRGLAQAHDIPLKKLYLRANKIGDAGIDALCAYLEASSTLEKFDLSRNECSTMGVVTIFNAFHRNKHTKIKNVNLAHNAIWDLDEERFGARSFLAKNQTLHVLNLEGNYIHVEGVQSLAKGIIANAKSGLERLYLGFNSIGDDGAIILAEVLERSDTLEYLGLAENAIGNPGARALLAAMETNTTITEITGLWRNNIDRRFIIVAIRRLLLAHDRLGSKKKLVAPSPTHPHPPSLSLDDQMSSLSADPDYASDNFNTSRGSNSSINGSSPYASPKKAGMNRKNGSLPARNGVNGSAAPIQIRRESNLPLDRLTVFQSSPLAYFDKNSSSHRRIPLQDYREEEFLLTQSLSYAVESTIEVSFKVATPTAFSLFLQEKENRVMHFSCHGHPDYITLENGFGLLHSLPVDGLSKLLSASGLNLQVVFVSSCHALSMGEAFVNAGVPHVVCCEREESFRDPVASEFAQIFYQALATDLSLQQAFDSACKAVALSEYATSKRNLMKRFRLLPQMPEVGSYHKIPVFFTGKPPQSDLPIRKKFSQSPPLPKNFLGREVDMFEILEALRVEDLIRISGPPGHGKASVVTAVADYVIQRKESYSIDNVFWLPPPQGVIPNEDSLYGDLCQCISILKDATEDIWDVDERLMECRDRIDIEMENVRSLLVVDDALISFKCRSAQEGVERFLSHLMNVSQVQVIKILSKSDASSAVSGASNMSRVSQSSKIEEANIGINPLDFLSTVKLYGGISKFISSTGCPAAHSASEFAELAEPSFISRMPNPSAVVSQRRSDLFVRMGSGIPAATVAIAEGQSKKDFIELIKIANIPEVYVDTLGALEKTIQKTSLERETAIEGKNYLRAMDLERIIEELEEMRPEYPNLSELQMEEEVLKADLTEAIGTRSYDEANRIKRGLLVLKKKIMKERMHARDHGKEATERMDEVQAQIQSMIDGVKLDDDAQSATFVVDCDTRDCSFVIEVGEVYDFKPPFPENGIVVWSNESCTLGGNPMHDVLLQRAGPTLANDISSLPIVVKTPYGPVRCSTGNAVIVGPEEYGELGTPCLILAVGPLSPDNSTDAIDDDTDTLHHIKIMLRSSYRSTLILARHAGLQALALSLLTTRKTGKAYKETIQIGLQTLVEEVRFSTVRHFRLMASSPSEAALLIGMMTEMGYRRQIMLDL
jgi:hypothetical protein